MDQNRAAGPQSGTPEAFERALKQYTQELMALYRRQRAEPPGTDTRAAEPLPEPLRAPAGEAPVPEPHTAAGQPHTQTRLRPEPETRLAQSGSSAGSSPRPAMPGNQTEKTPPEAAPGASEERTGREEQNAAPDSSGSPIDAVGREESAYRAGCDKTLARLREEVEGLLRGKQTKPGNRTGREEQNTAPDSSGSPIDAVGREEGAYHAGCDETLARLREEVEGLLRGKQTKPGNRSGREEQNAAPDSSGSPIDAVGREESAYRAGCDETLARLREEVEGLLRGRRTELETQSSREGPSDHSVWDRPAAPVYSPMDGGATSETKTTAGLLPYDTTTFAGSQASGGSSSRPSSGDPAGEGDPQGILKTQVFTARRAYPVEGAQVDLYQDREGVAVLIDSQFTDQSGKTRPVTVPALNKSLSEQPGTEHPYLSYHLHISHPDFVDAIIDHVAVFEDVVSIQSVDLIPTAAAPTPTAQFIEYPTPEEELL